MSIQSTKSITREQAIDRISMVDSYIRNSDYLKLADMSFEYDHDLGISKADMAILFNVSLSTVRRALN